jgi:hypothetical protein
MNEKEINIEDKRDNIKERLNILNKYIPEQEKKAYEKARDSL